MGISIAVGMLDRLSAAPVVSISDDTELVKAACRGNQSAFERLYVRYSRMVHGILLARVPPSEVDDLVQDVFLSMLREIGRLREPASFGGWLAAVARNRARDFHRQSHASEELPSEIPGARPRVAEALAALEAIRSLPQAYRETLILRLVEGMSGEEIAARTGLTAASVRVNLHRGMKMLRETLGKEERP